MDEKTRLLTLAHLKNGLKPAIAADRTGVSYGAALKLKKELKAAEEKNKIQQLFDLDKASLEILLESVTKELVPAIEAFDIGPQVEEQTHILTKELNGASVLNDELQNAGLALANKIKQAAAVSANADTILALSQALCELQTAFFGNTINTNATLPASSFEKHLRP